MGKLTDFSTTSVLSRYNKGLAIAGDPIAQTILAGQKLMKPKTQELTPPTVMPAADDEAVKAARRRRIAEIQARSGRASTILSQADMLGG